MTGKVNSQAIRMRDMTPYWSPAPDVTIVSPILDVTI